MTIDTVFPRRRLGALERALDGIGERGEDDDFPAPRLSRGRRAKAGPMRRNRRRWESSDE